MTRITTVAARIYNFLCHGGIGLGGSFRFVEPNTQNSQGKQSDAEGYGNLSDHALPVFR
jgi:hypothetical protein